MYVFTVEYMCRRYWSTLATIVATHAEALAYLKANKDFGGKIAPQASWNVSQYEVGKEDARLTWKYSLSGQCIASFDNVTPTVECEVCLGRRCWDCAEAFKKFGRSFHSDPCTDCSGCEGLGRVALGESEILKAERGEASES